MKEGDVLLPFYVYVLLKDRREDNFMEMEDLEWADFYSSGSHDAIIARLCTGFPSSRLLTICFHNFSNFIEFY